jgi:hypothetical protein
MQDNEGKRFDLAHRVKRCSKSLMQMSEIRPILTFSMLSVMSFSKWTCLLEVDNMVGLWLARRPSSKAQQHQGRYKVAIWSAWSLILGCGKTETGRIYNHAGE